MLVSDAPPVRKTAPAEMPVTLDALKEHISVTHEYHDAMITGYQQAAVDRLDGFDGALGRAIVTQEWTQNYDALAREMRLPMPASEVTSITWRDTDGQINTIAESEYDLHADHAGHFVRFRNAYHFPGDLHEKDAVTVTFSAGFGAAAQVPGAIKHAIMLMVGHWYANREAVNVGNIVNDVPMTVNYLISNYQHWL